MAPRRPPDRRVHRPRRRASSSAGTASRSPCSSIADLLGVPESRPRAVPRAARRLGSTSAAARSAAPARTTRSPTTRSSSSTSSSADVRRGPPARAARRRADRTGDGDVPRRLDARGPSTSPASPPTSSPPGRRRRVRLFGTALQRIGERSGAPAAAARRTASASRTSSRSACASRARSRATSGSRA